MMQEGSMIGRESAEKDMALKRAKEVVELLGKMQSFLVAEERDGLVVTISPVLEALEKRIAGIVGVNETGNDTGSKKDDQNSGVDGYGSE
jgi:hypothetical protein